MFRKIAVFGSVLIGFGLALVVISLLDGGGIEVQASQTAGEITVCPTASPSCDYTVIQDAVDAAGEGDVIKVAAGTYTGVNSYGGLAQVVYISKSLTLEGGYTSDFVDPPDPEVHPTTLDAEGNGRVVYITGDISVTVDGFRITGGASQDLGGGVCFFDSSVTLKNNLVISNSTQSQGGGLGFSGGEGNFDNNQFLDNSAGDGGGVYFYDSRVLFEANLFEDNVASNDGGAVFFAYGEARFMSNAIVSNTAHYGGGVFMGLSEDVLLQDNDIKFNSAIQGGGGLCLNGFDGVLRKNWICGNYAGGDGGGVHVSMSDPTIESNIVQDNLSGDRGGGLFISHIAFPSLVRNFVSGNEANQGGGLFLDWQVYAEMFNNFVVGNQALSGSGIYVFDSFPKLVQTTFAENSGGDGTAIHVASDYPAGPYSRVWLTNTIMVSHTVGVFVADVENTFVNLEATLWGNDSDWGGDGTIYTGTVNIWGDPDFVDPAVGNYHIGPDSAARDAGVDAGVRIDIDGEPRPYNGVYDIGADEYWPPGALKKVYLPLIVR